MDTRDPPPSGAELACEARSVSQEERDQLLEPFIAAACVALREFAGTEATVRAAYRQTSPQTCAELAAVIRLSREPGGILALGCSRPTAAALAGRILTGVTQELDEALIRDCLGELANVIAGQAKALLAGTPYHFAYAPPSVVSGADPRIQPSSESDCVVIAFGSDVGDVVLRLCQNV